MCDFFKSRWVLILVLLVFIIVKIPCLFYSYYWDESWPYVPAIMAMVKHGASLLPNAIDPELSRGHPLFFHAASAIWVRIFGASHAALHSFALFISVLFLITIYEAGARIFSKRVGIIALLLTVTDVMFFVQSTFVLFEVLIAFLCFLSICLYAKEKYVLATLSLTALFLTKESGLMAGFVIGIDALIGLFDRHTPIKKRLLKLTPITIACCAIGGFLLLQKYYHGWYVFPLYSDTVLTKWPDIRYRFRTGAVKTIFCWGYEYIFFITIMALSILAFIKTRKLSSLAFLFLAVPFTLAYYLIEDSRSVILGDGIAAFIAFIVFYVLTLFSFAKNDDYDTPLQRRTILLLGFFVLAFILFSSVAYFIPRYEMAAIICGLFLIAVFFDMLLRRSWQFLYYPLLAVIFIAAFFAFKESNEWADSTLGYRYGVKTHTAVVEYMERSNFYDRHIASGAFMEREHLTDRNTGFLSNDRVFTHVTTKIDSTTEFVIFDDIETDPNAYNYVLHDPSFELIYHIEMHGVWADIFKRKK